MNFWVYTTETIKRSYLVKADSEEEARYKISIGEYVFHRDHDADMDEITSIEQED